MTKMVRLSVVLGTMTLFLTGCNNADRAAWMASGIPALNRCVMADRPIPAGKTIETDDVLEVPVTGSNINPDAMMCKDNVIGKQAKSQLEQGSFLRSGDIADGKAASEELAKKFKESGNQLSALCPHTYSGFYDGDVKNSVRWKCSSEAGVAEGGKCDLNDFEQLKGEVHDAALQNTWMLAGRASKRGMFQGHAVVYSDIDYSPKTKVTIYKPLRDIPAGKPIVFKDLKAVVVTSDQAPVSAVCDAGLLGDSVAHVAIPAGKVIRAWDLEDEGNQTAMQTKEPTIDQPTEAEEKPAKRKGKKHK